MKVKGAGKGSTVAELLAGLPVERRVVMEKVREVVQRNLPAGYVEAFSNGMIAWVVPLSRYPDTYNGHPLWYVSLAAQKQYYSLHLMAVYGHPEHRARFEQRYQESGKKLDMGQACVRFKRLEDLPLDVIGETVASIPLEAYIEFVDRTLKARPGKRK